MSTEYEALITKDSLLAGMTIRSLLGRYYVNVLHYHANIKEFKSGVERKPLPETVLLHGMYICLVSESSEALTIFCGDARMLSKTKVQK